MQHIVRQFADRRPAGVADLAPGDRHRADERAGEAAEKRRRRNRDRNSRQKQRHQPGPERRQVQNRRYDDRMSVAEAEVIQQEAGHADRENNREIAVVVGLPEQGDEVAATGLSGHQQGIDTSSATWASATN